MIISEMSTKLHKESYQEENRLIEIAPTLNPNSFLN
jgi:hypothetical protein